MRPVSCSRSRQCTKSTRGSLLSMWATKLNCVVVRRFTDSRGRPAAISTDMWRVTFWAQMHRMSLVLASFSSAAI
eukprot:11023238-Lingulodinium_polyedra.AAC.1